MTIIEESRLEYHNDGDNSHKYWEYEIHDVPIHVVVRYGRVGGYGRNGSTRRMSTQYPSLQTATAFVRLKVGEKITKGYVARELGSPRTYRSRPRLRIIVPEEPEESVPEEKKKPKSRGGRVGRGRIGGL